MARHRLDRYVTLPTASLTDHEVDLTLQRLRANGQVEAIYEEPHAEPAYFQSAMSNTPDYLGRQHYLGSPISADRDFKVGGVNAQSVWALPGGDGSKARIISVEIGRWAYDHEDLPAPFLEHWDVQAHATDSHDTASVGSMVGKHNGFGVTGIAYGSVIGYSKYGAGDQLVDLAKHLKAGDVIQLGVHYKYAKGSPLDNAIGCGDGCYMPVEYFRPVFDAISYLTEEKGVHVVIAAANGNVNLDHPYFGDTFKRNVRDSGAIYAGAINPRTGMRAGFSEYGSRVDTYAWGGDVTTTSWSLASPTNLYTHHFNGTSSANPIIAASAAVVQSMAFARGMGAIPPKTLRRWLVESGNTPPVTDPGKPIGVQPDLLRVSFQ